MTAYMQQYLELVPVLVTPLLVVLRMQMTAKLQTVNVSAVQTAISLVTAVRMSIVLHVIQY